ncbi:MAG TPA: FHA domain-containing protein, partial [Longimicrobium sp.]|nr:FHA domain-containing protein [Longimicrobium sp.]
VPPAQVVPGQPAAAEPALPPGPPPLTPAQLEDKRRLSGQARNASRDSLTTASATTRVDLWKMVLIIDPEDTEAKLEYSRALGDLQTARTQEAALKQQQDAQVRTEAQQAADRREKLALAERALYARDLNSAEQIVAGVLAQSPDDPRASSMAAAIRQAQDARRFTRRMLIAAGALAAVGAVILVLLRKVGGKPGSEKAGASGPRAIVKVIDGVGRGRLAPIEKEVFRIGAADGERPDEKNDLVISDSASLVSRYHCTILRKGRDYFLLDSSLNGTRLNDEPLQRGEHQPLDDGDEIVLAGASRLKFLHT